MSEQLPNWEDIAKAEQDPSSEEGQPDSVGDTQKIWDAADQNSPFYIMPDQVPSFLERIRPLLRYCTAPDPAIVRAKIGEEEFNFEMSILNTLRWAVYYTAEQWKLILERSGFTPNDMHQLDLLEGQLCQAKVDAPGMVEAAEEILAQDREGKK